MIEMSGGQQIYDYFTKIAKGKRILEIGTLDGASAIAFLKGEPLEVVTVDSYSNEDYNQVNFDNVKVTSETAAQNLEPYKNCVRIIGRSPEAIKTQPTRHFDIAFLDGDHEYEGVKADFEAVKNLVKEDGLILFHDYREGNWGVKPFVDSLNVPVEHLGILAIVKMSDLRNL